MKQKVWFITGAAKGFGLEICKAALAYGDIVVATARKNHGSIAKDMALENNILRLQADVTNEAQVEEAVKLAISQFGRIDVLVNNAGYGLLAAFEEASNEEIKKQYDTNVFGLINVTQAVLPYMRNQRSGHVINISSLFGYMASASGFGIYGSTKFAVEGLSEGLSLEVKPLGINVTAVAPGLFSTNFASATSYHSSEIIMDSYAETVGAVRKIIAQLDGNQPGDPAKLAAVIIKLVASENPPLHLPIGKDAIEAFRKKTEQMQNEIEEWEAVSSSTSH